MLFATVSIGFASGAFALTIRSLKGLLNHRKQFEAMITLTSDSKSKDDSVEQSQAFRLSPLVNGFDALNRALGFQQEIPPFF
ncbi:MAG: hypothetical protein HW389_1184 [Bacteroidetes bacterium]|nr:hypothetical protein [Bacteroidota bacterium]